ncbi:MAG: nicotinate phosphoribosyltransferase [Erysipelotrichaceae bacterium]
MNYSLLTDFYELSMAYAYYQEGRAEQIAYFDMFTRNIPDNGGYLVFNGLASFIEYYENFSFNEEDLAYLKDVGNFSDDFLDYLRNLKLTLDVWSVPEGTVVFANEPLVTVSGPLIQCQLIETMLLLCVNYESLISTKASRINNAAQGRMVLEFGARRAQGAWAALKGARAAVIGGCFGTSNTMAAKTYDLNVSGTMAHSYVQIHKNEYQAFMSYAQQQPDNCTFLIDTYDTLNSGIVNAVKVAQEYLLPNGYQLKGVRLDSGDLAYLSKKVRIYLDAHGFYDTKIVASNSLNEELIDDLLTQGAKIDIFGVGEQLITSASKPVLGGVYKVVAYQENGVVIPTIKLSDTKIKITNPGHKKLYRFYDNNTNKALGDVIALADEVISQDEYELFDPVDTYKRKVINNYTLREMQEQVYQQGKLVYRLPSTNDIITYHQKELETIWDELKRLKFPHEYYVDLSAELWVLKEGLIYQNKKFK